MWNVTQNWMSWTYLFQRDEEVGNFLLLKNKYNNDNISDILRHITVSFKFQFYIFFQDLIS